MALIVKSIGIVANENAPRAPTRADILNEWVLPYWPACPIYGKWSEEGKQKINRLAISTVTPTMLRIIISTWHSTFIMPASGSGWATAKPWEFFIADVVCFFHPDYDTTDSILSDAPPSLHKFLRVESPEMLRQRVDAVHEDDDLFTAVVGAQRAHYDTVREKTHSGLLAIEQRLDLEASHADRFQ